MTSARASTLKASGAPDRSRMEPRSAGRVISLVRCRAEPACSAPASGPWTTTSLAVASASAATSTSCPRRRRRRGSAVRAAGRAPRVGRVADGELRAAPAGRVRGGAAGISRRPCAPGGCRRWRRCPRSPGCRRCPGRRRSPGVPSAAARCPALRVVAVLAGAGPIGRVLGGGVVAGAVPTGRVLRRRLAASCRCPPCTGAVGRVLRRRLLRGLAGLLDRRPRRGDRRRRDLLRRRLGGRHRPRRGRDAAVQAAGQRRDDRAVRPPASGPPRPGPRRRRATTSRAGSFAGTMPSCAARCASAGGDCSAATSRCSRSLRSLSSRAAVRASCSR